MGNWPADLPVPHANASGTKRLALPVLPHFRSRGSGGGVLRVAHRRDKVVIVKTLGCVAGYAGRGAAAGRAR